MILQFNFIVFRTRLTIAVLIVDESYECDQIGRFITIWAVLKHMGATFWFKSIKYFGAIFLDFGLLFRQTLGNFLLKRAGNFGTH